MAQITTDIELALADLRRGHPVAIPTETVYGLAAPIDNEAAIRQVFALKNRPLDHPLIVHVHPDWDLLKWVEALPDHARLLMNTYWPGPLTLVLKRKKDSLSDLITGKQATVAIRCPAHPLAQTLLKALGTPVVAPSANPFGKVSPTTPHHVQQAFANHDLTILEGGRCTVGIESTILDASIANQYKILRPGMISAESIAATLDLHEDDQASTIRVPGKLKTHYQPEKPLYYFEDPQALQQFCVQEQQPLFVIAQQNPAPNANHITYHPMPDNAEDMAYELYYQLKEADQSQAKLILIQLPQDRHAWSAIRERIMKAGQRKG